MRATEVGGIEDSDIVTLNSTQQPGAILVFGEAADRSHISLPSYLSSHHFNVVYAGIQWLKEQLIKHVPRSRKESIVARARVQQTFRASRTANGNAAGAIVELGVLRADAPLVRISRSSKGGSVKTVVHEGAIAELRRFKEKVPLVEQGLECGVVMRDDFLFAVGDELLIVEVEEVEPDLEETFLEAKQREDAERKKMDTKAT